MNDSDFLFLKVYETEDSDPVEIPIEDDDTVLFSTLGGQFPRVCGLKYHPSTSGNSSTYRAVKLSDGKLYKPPEGWHDVKLICVFAKEGDNKRKFVEENEICSGIKTKRLDGFVKKCTDLIVLNLGWKVDEEILRSYFKKWGDVVLVQVKKDRDTGQSRGYGFVRFAEYDSQVACLMSDRHIIDGRVCAVKVPFSKAEADKQEISKKIHISYTNEELTSDDLKEAFEEYGTVNDIFIPKPFRNFAFVTFDNSDIVQSLIGKTISINGQSVLIGTAVPKITNPNSMNIHGGNLPNNMVGPGGRRGNNYNSGSGGNGDMYTSAIYQPSHQNYNNQNRISWNSYESNGGFKAPYHQSGCHNSRPTRHHRQNYGGGGGGGNMYPHSGGVSNRNRINHQELIPATVQPTDNMGQNTIAMAALHIFNHPEVYNAVMSAANAYHGANNATMANVMMPSSGTYHNHRGINNDNTRTDSIE